MRGLVGAASRALVVAASVAGAALGGAPRADEPEVAELTGGVVSEPVPINPAFPDAVAPGTLRWVCADDLAQLTRSFEERQAPLEPHLVRRRHGRLCHIDYTPSVPGFRADADDQPISELYINVDTLHLLSRRTEQFGDTLDISKAILANLPRPLPITMTAERSIARRWYTEAAEFHYGAAARQISWRPAKIPVQANPWTQDFLKSGRGPDGERRILVTRHLYEGRQEDGDIYDPMLSALDEPQFARSNLSWEGGDLQFIRNPRHPERLILVYGDSVRTYWAENLESDEYGYVLRREFGADEVLDLTEIVPHVDYFAAFLMSARTVLISQPVTGRQDMARAAATALVERFGGKPPARLAAVAALLDDPAAFSDRKGELQAALARAKAEAREGWPMRFDRDLNERMTRHVAETCPMAPQACFSDGAILQLLADDPDLLQRWATAALRMRSEEMMDLRLLSVIESQLRDGPLPVQARIDSRVRELEGLGLRVVRVPRFGGDRGLEVPWAGLSYVNALLVDRTLFVPTFGLGPVEDGILEDIRKALPADYTLIPVYARHMLLYNGGVHCSVAIVRD